MLYAFVRSAWLERATGRYIERVPKRHTDLANRDFASAPHPSGEYRAVELRLEPGDTVMLYGRESAIADLDQRRSVHRRPPIEADRLLGMSWQTELGASDGASPCQICPARTRLHGARPARWRQTPGLKP